MSRRKILFVVPLPPPMAGVEQMSQTILSSAINHTFDIHVLRSNIRTSNKDKGTWDLIGILRVLLIGLKLLLQIIIFRPNLVYLTISQNSSGLARDCYYLFFCWITLRPVVGHLHGDRLPDFLQSQNYLLKNFYLFFLRRMDNLIVLSHSAKERLGDFLTQKKISVVFNAIQPLPEKDLNGTSPNKKITVGFMGHLSEAKGFFDLVDASEKLLTTNSNLRFIFAGEKLAVENNIPNSQNSKRFSKSAWDKVDTLLKRFPNELEQRGIVVGEQKDEFFNEVDIFALPSHSESFPLAVLEALSKGIPLVVTPVGALPEFLKDGQNCLFVRPGDSTSLSAAISQLSEDSKLRRKMSEANKKLSQSYLIENRASEYSAIFNSVMG